MLIILYFLVLCDNRDTKEGKGEHMNIKGKDSAHLMALWEARQEVVNLMGRLFADYVVNEERGMYGLYWPHP